MKKTCKTCEIEKETSEFYNLHSVCKDCGVKKAILYNKVNYEKKRASDARYYVRHRARLLRRAKAYIKTPSGKESRKKYQIKWHGENGEKKQAHSKVNFLIRCGEIKKLPCGRCGDGRFVHAHHEDYSRPLNIVWLCPLHHAERHAELDRMI